MHACVPARGRTHDEVLSAVQALLPASLWALYLSLVNLGGWTSNYGWEWLTLELGFLSIFLCPLLTIWRSPLPLRVPPPPLVLFLFRWFVHARTHTHARAYTRAYVRACVQKSVRPPACAGVCVCVCVCVCGEREEERESEREGGRERACVCPLVGYESKDAHTGVPSVS